MCIDCHLHPDAAPDASLRAGCVWKHGSPVHRAVGVARAGRRPCLWSAVHPWQGTSWLASVDSFSVRRDEGQAALKSRIRGPRTRAHPLVGNTQAGNRQVPTGGPKAACCRSGRKEPRADPRESGRDGGGGEAEGIIAVAVTLGEFLVGDTLHWLRSA